MIEGTRLRRFGDCLVTQPRRGRGAFWLVYREDQRALYSECAASANEGARRLATGRPLLTPDEERAHSLRHYAMLYPSRFVWCDSAYLTGALSWVNGGLVDTDVTTLTPEGCALIAAREDARRARLPETLRGWAVERDAEERALSARYLGGAWPETDERTTLYPAVEGSCRMGDLLRMPTASIAPEWLDDARAAMRLLLAHGRNSEHGDTLATLRAWASRLAERHGGEWSQTAAA